MAGCRSPAKASPRQPDAHKHAPKESFPPASCVLRGAPCARRSSWATVQASVAGCKPETWDSAGWHPQRSSQTGGLKEAPPAQRRRSPREQRRLSFFVFAHLGETRIDAIRTRWLPHPRRALEEVTHRKRPFREPPTEIVGFSGLSRGAAILGQPLTETRAGCRGGGASRRAAAQ